MAFVDDFKSFILKGNVMDLAVAVIVGGAFGKIIDSLVNNVIMPPISLLTGKGFDNSFLILQPGSKAAPPYATLKDAIDAGATVMAYGSFLTAIMNFVIIALVVFVMIRVLSKAMHKHDDEPVKPTPSEALLTEIRDLLRKGTSTG